MQINVCEWLERTARNYPDKTALCDENENLTYRQYHDLAVGLAHHICDKGIGTKKPIAVIWKRVLKRWYHLWVLPLAETSIPQ